MAQSPGDTDQTFTLPDWIDEDILSDFLSASRGLLDDLEADILAYENGSEEALARFKGRLHSLKGEAGVLGLEALAGVCHSLEDYLELPGTVEGRADQLLRARDWFSEAFDAYAKGKRPPMEGHGIDEVLALGETIATGTEAPPDLAGFADDDDFGDFADDDDFPSDDAESTEEQDVVPEVIAQPEVVVPEVIAEAVVPEVVAEAVVPEVVAQPEVVVPAPVAAVQQTWGDDMMEVIEEFLQESSDGLAQVDTILLDIEKEFDLEKVNALFRVFHSIKGVSAFIEIDSITKLAHATETLLNCVREGTHPLEGINLDLVFDATTLMQALVQALQTSVEGGGAFQTPPQVPQLVEKLEAAVEQRAPAIVEAPTSETETETETTDSPSATVAPEAPAKGPAVAKQSKTKLKETVKIDLERVDSLVEMIGELVIVESMVVHAPEIAALASPHLRNYFSQLDKITRDLQDIGMRMRMVPVRGVFQKMARMVRDLSRRSGKRIQAELFGEGTEMDRSMVEHIADPLVHMIRNAVDHGLEEIDERQAAGKSPTGAIKLSAYHQGGSIVIEIADDGRGLNKAAILHKAIDRGIIQPGEQLSDAEIYNLIFAPGFSTAEKVTEISGRGVGMDVVRRNIEAMRGRVSISSELGRGSVFKLILPLTLAIIDGMVISCGSEQYILPTLSIIESLRPTAQMIHSITGRGALITIRDESLPLLRLDDLFGITDAIPNPSEAQVVVVETSNGKIGLLVDEVIAQQQVVIKSLGADLASSQFLSGAAILSDGRVGLIVNLDELSSLAAEYTQRRSFSPETSTQPITSAQGTNYDSTSLAN